MTSTRQLRQTDTVSASNEQDLPSIDAAMLLSSDAADQQEVATTIRRACRDYGCFYISGLDGVGDGVARMLHSMRDFFALHDDDKRKQVSFRATSDYGWRPMFNEPAYQAGTVAHMESFDCGRKHIDGSANPIWPGLETFESDAKRCWQDLTAIGNATLRALARAVGMDATFLVDNCSSKELDTLRLLHYPQNDAPACGRNVGISAHTDFECMTLIYQSSPGLELTDPNGDWFDAPSHDGRLVVLIDDMLERWTNGELQATGHRVRNTPEQRFSIVMFFAVNPGIEVAPLPRFVSEDRPARYPAVTQEANIEQEMNSAQSNFDAMATKG